MSNCTNCHKKFLFLKLNRIKCMECGQSYCLDCICKKNGLYCKICLVLNTRPVNRSNLMDLRSREMKLYLAKRKIPTENCIEKEDLINRFLWYADVEHKLQKNGCKRNNFNDFMATLTNSMPNLFETNQPRRSEGNSSFQGVRRPENTASSSSNQANATTTNNVARPPPPAPPPPPPAKPEEPRKKIIRLADIKNAEDISNLSVKQLKELLFINRVDFKGCVEKEELTEKAIKLWVDTNTADNPDDLPTEDLCKICMNAPLNSVFLECGHIATCIDCGKQLAECPICRQYIVRVVHTFKS